LKENPTAKFTISGHTDSVGNAASNLKLSNGRAAAVKNYLVSNGVAADRLTSNGFGDTQPIDNNTTSKGKANNRRVEVKYVK
jgi:outer membrane protein OmpA-like peptidoglycan-associated protein